MSAILELKDIFKSYPNGSHGRKNVLCGANLTVERGELVGLVGKNGCGKSALVDIALRLTSPDSGRILFSGADITDYAYRQMRPVRRQFQAVFQSTTSSLNPRMRVSSILSESLKNYRIPYDRAMLTAALAAVNLPSELLDRLPSQLSGGQKQRVAIARAMLLCPEMIVFDEVTSNLDTVTACTIIELIRTLAAENGTAGIFVTHDIASAMKLCGQVPL